MRYLVILLFFLINTLISEELKIKADKFSANQTSGISTFEGNVEIKKSLDELNASKVIIYTDKKNKPIKFIVKGDVSFHIETKKESKYGGYANKVIYIPKTKEYKFFGNVHLKQLDKKKEILGDEVILKINSGKAYAKGIDTEPVIMIFDIPDKENKEKIK